jgi:hypothetical protein
MLRRFCLFVELKAVEKILPIHKAQLLSYMKLLNKPLGLLINFHEIVLKDGIHRLVSLRLTAVASPEFTLTWRHALATASAQTVEPKSLVTFGAFC